MNIYPTEQSQKENNISKKKEKRVAEKVVSRTKIGRNQLCPCGSNKKYKFCCMRKQEIKQWVSVKK